MERLHFMGIGGVSMSGLARWYHAEGHPVSGCDAVASTAVAELRAAGIAVAVGHHPSHLDDTDVLVSTMAVPNDGIPHSGAEVAEAERCCRSIKRIDLLADLFERRRAVAITGTHGKSTTTGMAATLVLALVDDPSIQIGARLNEIGSNYRYGLGERRVAEVDESDPGFARLRSAVAVITNLEDDHIAGDYDERRNYHASLVDLERAARTFASRAEAVLRCADWPGLAAVLDGVPHQSSYGRSADADYRIDRLDLRGDGSSFDLVLPTGSVLPVTLAVPGEHNALNAAAALGATHLSGLDPAAGLDALAAFAGVGRRWQRWGNVEGALIIDDYAHHPTEVAATLQAARDTGRRVRAVLQPHRWIRTARHWPALADAAALADEVLVLDVYGAGETEIPGISPALIVDRLLAAGNRASRHDHASAGDYLAASLSAGDLIITLGAGDVWRIAERLAAGGEGTGD
jgi:UDP-N-acetylmuramate--alanine ligase